MPAILLLPCCNANRGRAVVPNFPGGTLKLPIFRSLIFAALIFFARPLGKCAYIGVGADAIPSELTKDSLSAVTNAPVSRIKRPGCPWTEHGTVSAPFSSRRMGTLLNFSDAAIAPRLV